MEKLYNNFEEWYEENWHRMFSGTHSKVLLQEAYEAGQKNCHCKIRQAEFKAALEAVYQEIMTMPEGEWKRRIEAEAFKYITPDEHWWLGK